MYVQILRTSIIEDCNKEERDELAQQFRDTIRSIVVLFNSLFIVVLAELSSSALSKMISTILNPLKSMLNVPKDQYISIQLFHPSFRNFLVDKKRCRDEDF